MIVKLYSNEENNIENRTIINQNTKNKNSLIVIKNYANILLIFVNLMEKLRIFLPNLYVNSRFFFKSCKTCNSLFSLIRY